MVLSGIEDWLLNLAEDFYDAVGLLGVFVMMAVETIAFPLPSEFVMPLAGWMLVKEDGHSWPYLILLALVGGAGSTVGGLAFYYLGLWGGRPLLLKYGKWVMISEKDLERGDRFFAKWGAQAVFFARLIPLVRSIISFPAGVAGMNVFVFTALTFAGSCIWAFALAYAGYELGRNWEDIRQVTRPADIPVLVGIVLVVGWYVWRHLRDRQRAKETGETASEAQS